MFYKIQLVLHLKEAPLEHPGQEDWIRCSTTKVRSSRLA